MRPPDTDFVCERLRLREEVWQRAQGKSLEVCLIEPAQVASMVHVVIWLLHIADKGQATTVNA